MTLYAPCNWPCHIPRARLLECWWLFQLIGDPCRWFRGLDFMLWMCLGSRSNAKVTTIATWPYMHVPSNWPCHIPKLVFECLVNFFYWLVILVGGLEDLILCCGCAWVQDQMQKLQPSQHDLICTMQLTMSHTKSSSSRMLGQLFQLIGDPCRWFRGLDFMLWMCLGSRSNAKVTTIATWPYMHHAIDHVTYQELVFSNAWSTFSIDWWSL